MSNQIVANVCMCVCVGVYHPISYKAFKVPKLFRAEIN